MKEIEYLKKYLPKDKLKQGLQKLKEGKPVQYIIGNVDFYNVNWYNKLYKNRGDYYYE